MTQRFVRAALVVAVGAGSAWAQSVISAKSGLVHYYEGDVSVNGKTVADKTGTFTDIKKDGVLATDLGRAEVLLTPGVFLRVGEHASVKMLSTSLADTRVELVSGNTLVESDTPMKDNLVTVVYKDYSVTFLKHGLYAIGTEPAELKVYSGEASVAVAGGAAVVVHEGRLMPFSAALATEKFDTKSGDALYRWSRNRSEYISIANVSAAKTANSNGYPVGNYGSWFYNGFYGMYTYLPAGRGTLLSPFGFSFYSPFSVINAYNDYGYYNNYTPSGGTVTRNNELTRSSTLAAQNPVQRGITPPTGGGVGAVSTGGGGGHAGGKGH